MGRREWYLLAGALGLALLLRLLYLSEIASHPLYQALTADPAEYHAQARAILEGRPVPDYAYFHSSPLYPFFLAFVMRVAGPGLAKLRLAQALVGCLSVFLIYRLTRVTVGAVPAIVAAFLAALYVPFIFFEGEILEITLVLAFLAGSLILLVRARTSRAVWPAAVSGALLGLASLGKPNLLLFAPVAAALVAWGRSSDVPARSRALSAVALLAATAVAISPATVHNYRVSGDFIPVSSNAGINLYIGNHPGAPGTFTVPPEMRLDLRTASARAAEEAVGHPLSAGEVSDYWARQALDFARRRPAMWFLQTARKFALFWNWYEIPNHYHLYFIALAAPVLRFPVGTFSVVAPLGLVGLALAAARRRKVGVLIAFGAAFLCSVVPFFVTARYRLPITLALLPGAGYALSELVGAARRRRRGEAARIAIAAGALAALVNVHMITFGFAPMHNTLGSILGSRGDFEGAVSEFSLALKEDPASLSARYNLGLALLELGRYDEAAVAFERAIQEFRRYDDAWVALGRARAAEGRIDEARQAWLTVLSFEPPPAPAIASEARSLLENQAAEERER
jgi:4-amino-4-deoxy-L-arabinose transferase-like glycosyltransferase